MADEADGVTSAGGVGGGAMLMDLAWERQQKKTFTAWINSHLRKLGSQISEIDRDFNDGKLLLGLLEVISGDKLARPEKGKMRVHKVSNVNKALDYIATKGVRLANIGAEEIVDGNLKMTLGMIWTIILRFAIQDISVEEMTAKEGLLLWCQRKTAPYKNVNVQNFHMSFKDGLAFCGLIHRHRPDLIDMDSLRKDTPEQNLKTAFEVAERDLDIPQMLDVEDMLNQVKPDERAVMTYVSAYYHAFSSSQQAENAAKRIGKVLDINKENERLMEEYENLASDLLTWIQQVVPWLGDRTQEKTLQAARDRLNEFRNYRTDQKPPKAEEKGRLEAHFNTLQTKLRISSRPAYMPSEGRMIHDIAVAWKGLDANEKSYEEFLMAEINRLERLEHLAAKFQHKAAVHEAWTNGKDDLLSADDIDRANLAGVLALKKQHEAFESDLAAHEDRVEQLETIAKELENLGYCNSGEVSERMAAISSNWEGLRTLSDQRMKALAEAEQVQMQLDELRLDFAKKAAPFNNWMDGAKEELQDVFNVHSVQETEQLIESHDSFKSNIQVAQGEYDGLMAVAGEINTLGGGNTPNPYSNLTCEDINTKWEEVLALLPQRDEALSQEQERQQEHERLRLAFAEKANLVGPWLEEQTEYLATLGLQNFKSLEEHQEALHAEETKAVEYNPNMEELEEANQHVHEAFVFDNPHTEYSMDTLRVTYQQLKTAISRNINAVENQILTRDSMGLTEEQLQELRQSFNHFDKDHSGELDRNEFKACLLSLGTKLGNGDDQEAKLTEMMQKVDPNETGRVTFDAYLDFMTRQATDEDSAEQVLQSFKILAGDKLYITEGQLRSDLPPGQADYCIQRMSPYAGDGAPEDALDYQSFASALYGQSDL